MSGHLYHAGDDLMQRLSQDDSVSSDVQYSSPSLPGYASEGDLGVPEEPVSSSTSRQPIHQTAHSSSQISSFLWLLSCSAGLSGLLFGYDTGVVSSTLVSIRGDLGRDLSTLDKSLITSVTSLGALIASPLAPFLADASGRKKVILLTDLLFIIGALWQATCTSVWSMIVGRAIVGLAVGAAAFVTPLYISELSPELVRGRLVTVYSLFLTGGQVAAYLMGFFQSSTPGGWRPMVGLGALPALLQMSLLFFMPESPRWLYTIGRASKAEEIIHQIYRGTDGIKTVVARLSDHVEASNPEQLSSSDRNRETPERMNNIEYSSKRPAILSLFQIASNRRALTIACMLQAAQQLTGFNSLMYFSATIFLSLGFNSPTLTSLSIAITNFVFTIVAFSTIDRLGRRQSLLLSIPFMAAALLFCSISFYFYDNGTLLQQTPTVGDDEMALAGGSLWAWLIVGSTVSFTAAYAVGLGCVPWQQSELFPLHVRALGSGLATAVNWSSNFAVGITFLPLMAALAPAGTFAVYAMVCVGTWAMIWLIYPETAGLSLEDAGHLLSESWGVAKSMERWRYQQAQLASVSEQTNRLLSSSPVDET